MINNIYLNNKVIGKIKEEFDKTTPNRIVLQEFFDSNTYRLIKEWTNNSTKTKEKIADRYSYTSLDTNSLEKIFNSKELVEFLGIIINKKIGNINLKANQFFHKDYTLISDSIKYNSGLKFFFFLPSQKFNKECGGNKIFRINGGNDDNLIFSPTNNTFCLINTSKNDLSFVQYLNNKAKKENLIIIEGEID